MKKPKKTRKPPVRNDKLLKEFGNNLRKIRKHKGITQEELAFKIGLEISQISRIERGILNSTISTAYEIASALNVDLKDLFDFSKKD
ncbi:helix-turn-helix transcriptional regulator [uncultured Winogradskyella sp.]|uniref:helix-turn-helix domain-containing protein n=1 Tax=uncultured Winogradskyella sp. TaxID=395353 RepID=UPI00260B3A24|nr:helix-turn-helix transcriptional regulator [uncultured Winogradskyella sp.]